MLTKLLKKAYPTPEIEVEAQVNIFKIDLLKKRNMALVPKLIKRLETQVAKNKAAAHNDRKYGFKTDSAELTALKNLHFNFLAL